MPEASGTTINLVVSYFAARAVLWPDFAPKSVAALVRSLPLEHPLCKWSGPACFAELAGEAISTIECLETPVISIYAGVLGLRPPHPGLPSGELLLAYGDAEFRMPDGRRFVTPLGEIEPGSDAVLAALARTATEGRATLRLTVAEAG